MSDKQVVLDASALLALVNEEKGCEMVADYLPNAIMSTVNLSETATVLMDIGIELGLVEEILTGLIDQPEPFTNEQAYIAASLRKSTKKLGLSLGDRACLSLAKMKNFPVITADKIWQKLDINLDIRLIR